MKTKFLASVTVIAFVLSLFSVMAQKKEERKVDEFNAIGFGIHGDLFLTQGTPQKVAIEADEDVLAMIATEVSDGVLKIKFNKPNFSSRSPIKVWVTVPEINGLHLAGSGNILGEGKMNSDEMELKVSGSGNINLKALTAKEIAAAISGSGNITLEGSAGEMDATISGSGNISTEKFSVEECGVKISGSGNCSVDATKELDVAISGSGKVYYVNNPQVNASISGSGKVAKLE